MKFKKSFIFLASLISFSCLGAKADRFNSTDINGWSKVGSSCGSMTSFYTKYEKNNSTSNDNYGVYYQSSTSTDKWIIKNVTKGKANSKMNQKCDTQTYQPTS